MPGWLATLLAAALLAAPRAAEACYVCTSGRNEDTRLAFILTTALLSVLPLALVGGIVWWIVRRARRLEP